VGSPDNCSFYALMKILISQKLSTGTRLSALEDTFEAEIGLEMARKKQNFTFFTSGTVKVNGKAVLE